MNLSIMITVVAFGISTTHNKDRVLPGGMHIPSPVYNKVRDWLNNHPNQIARVLECISDHDDHAANKNQTKMLQIVKDCEDNKLK